MQCNNADQIGKMEWLNDDNNVKNFWWMLIKRDPVGGVSGAAVNQKGRITEIDPDQPTVGTSAVGNGIHGNFV